MKGNGGFMKITGFLHKGLERFALTGDTSGVQPKHATKLRMILIELERAENLRSIQEPSLHSLAKKRPAFRDRYSIRVNGNWRLTFKYNSHSDLISDLNYVDYH